MFRVACSPLVAGLAVAFASLAGAAQFAVDEGCATSSNRYVALRFDAKTGSLIGLSTGGATVAHAPEQARACDLSIDGRWLVGNLGKQPSLARFEHSRLCEEHHHELASALSL